MQSSQRPDPHDHDQPAEGGEVPDAGPGAEHVGDATHRPSPEQAAENRENEPPA